MSAIHQPAEQATPDRILRLREVMRLTTLSRASLYRRMTAKTFPAAVSLGGSSIGWRQSDVMQWVAALPKAVQP